MSAGPLSLLPAPSEQCAWILSSVSGAHHSRWKRREQVGGSPLHTTFWECWPFQAYRSAPRGSARTHSRFALSSDRFPAQRRSASL